MSKAYAVNVNFDGADFTNSVLDRVIFNGESPAHVSLSAAAERDRKNSLGLL